MVATDKEFNLKLSSWLLKISFN